MATQQPSIPGWVTVPVALADLHVLAYRAYRESGSVWHDGITATAVWVRGAGTGPVTFRQEQPVTRALAEAEWWAAVYVDSDGVKPPLESMCRRLDVAYQEPVALNRVWARGVEAVLAWLTSDPLQGRSPPLRVPDRDADGNPATAEQLYHRFMEAAPHAEWGPEQRHALRNRTEADAARSQRLVALIDETVRLVRASA
ncbi:MAG: hypothetical protein GEV09_15925 [Pseudonocardiaceae bacterium]|nr:hypothetical protein [Pseudonocardiaceae bacterium]